MPQLRCAARFSVCPAATMALLVSAGFVSGRSQEVPRVPRAKTPFNCVLPPQLPVLHRDFPMMSDLPEVELFPDLLPLTPIEKLGKLLIFDETLSDPPGQACASCHALDTGFRGPSSLVNFRFGGIMPGAVKGRFGKRIPPSFAYITYSLDGPYQFTNDEGEESVAGGIMWDGRFRNMMDLGASVDPNEMANTPTPSQDSFHQLRQGFSKVLARKLPHRPSASLWRKVFGKNDFTFNPAARNTIANGGNTVSGEERVFRHFLEACEAYCASPEVNSFSSKFDAAERGTTRLSRREQRGQALFFGKAQCSNCHSSDDPPFPLRVRGRQPIKGNLFTGYCFNNTGIPQNPRDPALATDPTFLDVGLAGNSFKGTDSSDFTSHAKFRGRFLVPTLRNVNRRRHHGFVKAFMHNGAFHSLEEVVHFYNERNVAISLKHGKTGKHAKVAFDLRDGPPEGFRAQFPPPEVLENVNNVAGNSPKDAGDDVSDNGEVGNLGLTDNEEADLVAFLKTLDDGFMAPQH